MAPRASWKGYLKLSLVSCAVNLYPAASSSSRVSFNTINRTTGMFTGFFTAPDGSKPAFNGVVLTKSLSTQSAGFFLTTAPKVNDYTGQAGNVILTATP